MQGIGRPALPPLLPLRLPPAEGLGAVSTARSPVGGAEAVEVEAPLDDARELRPLPPPPPPSPEWEEGEARRGELAAEAAGVALLSMAERGRFQPLIPSSASTATLR